MNRTSVMTQKKQLIHIAGGIRGRVSIAFGADVEIDL